MIISFVIPAYNEENYVADCIRSILNETCGRSDTEIVVVNNASTDRTREVAQAFEGVRVVDEPKKGLTQARHAGYLATSGVLVANVDADSRLPEGWLEQVLAKFDEDPGLAAFSGPLVYYDLGGLDRILVSAFYGIAWLTYAVNQYLLHIGSMIQGGNFVVRRTALDRIGGFNREITFYGEDADLARRLPEAGRVLFSLKLRMYSSARRLKREGVFTMATRYAANYLSTIFLKRPCTERHIDIREELGS